MLTVSKFVVFELVCVLNIKFAVNMSGKQLKPDSTPVILKNLAIVIPAFYASYYAIAAIFSAIAGITMDGKEPFDHAIFSPAEAGRGVGKYN